MVSSDKFQAGEYAMNAFLLACVGAVVIAVVAAIALNFFQEPAAQAFSTSAVRL
jgi:hypothetical protein